MNKYKSFKEVKRKNILVIHNAQISFKTQTF